MIYQVYEQKKVDFAKKELHKSMSRGRVNVPDILCMSPSPPNDGGS